MEFTKAEGPSVTVGDLADQGSHFWFMTVQAPNARGYFVGSYQGTRNPRRNSTRLDQYNAIWAEVQEADPRARGGVVIAFDIQPNHH